MASLMVRFTFLRFESLAATFDRTPVTKTNFFFFKIVDCKWFTSHTSKRTNFSASIAVPSTISVDATLCPCPFCRWRHRFRSIAERLAVERIHASAHNRDRWSYALWLIRATKIWKSTDCTRTVRPVLTVHPTAGHSYVDWVQSVWREWNDSGWSKNVCHRLWNHKIYIWILFAQFRLIFGQLLALPRTFSVKTSFCVMRWKSKLNTVFFCHKKI